MELIDRTKLPRTVTHWAETEYDIGFEEGQQSIIEAINDAPTVDAVQVVLCDDCKYANPVYDLLGIIQNDLIYCKNIRCHKKIDWYCADGKRKEG